MKLIQIIFVIIVFLIIENDTTMLSRFKAMAKEAASCVENKLNYKMFQKTKNTLKPKVENVKNKVHGWLQKYVKIIQSKSKPSISKVLMRGSKRMLLVNKQKFPQFLYISF